MINENTVRDPLPYGKPSKSFDLFGFIKRYGLFILIAGSFLFTISVPIVILLSKPNYEVKALFRVEPVLPSLITTSEDPSIINYYQDYARTQALRMMSFDVMKKTVEKLTPHDRASLFSKNMPLDQCATRLAAVIKTNPLIGTHLIEISASSPQKDGLAPVVNNFMTVFIEKVRHQAEMQDNVRLTFLRNKKETLTAEISTLENKLILLSKDINTATFEEVYNLAGKKTEQLQKLYVQSLNDQITAKTQLDEKVKLNSQLKSLSLEPMVDEMVIKSNSLDLTSSWTYQQLQQMRSSTDGLTKTNPDRIYIEQRMNAMQDYEKKQRNELNKNAHKILYGKRDFDLSKDLITAKNDLERANTFEKQINVELKKSNVDALKTSTGIHQGEWLEAELKHKRELLNHIDTRITELEVEGKAPLRLSVESLARKPDQAEGSNIKKLFFIFFGLSFGSVGGVFFAYEFFDNRIRGTKDIFHALGYPPACSVPKVSEEIPFHHLLSKGHDQEAAKAIRSFAIRLDREKTDNNASVILFTGVDIGTGSTSMALNTAHALGTLMKKVLLIEGNFSTPALSKLNGLSSEPEGLCEFLSFTKPWNNYIVNSPLYNIDILYAGNTLTGNIPQHRIQELLRLSNKEYDFICVDSSPILQSDLTEHFALFADIIVLISLGASTYYKDMRKAAELLVRLKVPAIAPLLNWGGTKRSISIDKLLEKQPQILHEINIKRLEEIIRNLPPIKDVVKKINSVVNNTLNKTLKQKRNDKK